MTYTLTKDQALRLAQMHIVSSTHRPTLMHMELRFETDRIVAIASDAYRLAVYVFETHDDDQVSNRPEVTVHVPAKEFSDTIKAVLKFAPKGTVKDLQRITLLPYHDDNNGTDNIDVSGVWDRNAPEITVTDTLQGVRWVKWESLFRGQSFNGLDASTIQEAPEGTRLPSFNSQYLADLPKLLGPTAATRNPMEPIQMAAAFNGITDPEKGNLLPWLFYARTRGSGLSYLQMPVRR